MHYVVINYYALTSMVTNNDAWMYLTLIAVKHNFKHLIHYLSIAAHKLLIVYNTTALFLIAGEGGWFDTFRLFKSILFIEFRCTLSISYKIIPYYIYYCILIR